MHLESKKLLALVIAVVIALLPFRFAHAASGGNLALDQSNAAHGGPVCDRGADMHSSHQGTGHAHDGASIDDCCGDQCAGAQVLVPSSLDLHFSPSRDFNHPWIERLPEVLAFIKFRPPIFFS